MLHGEHEEVIECQLLLVISTLRPLPTDPEAQLLTGNKEYLLLEFLCLLWALPLLHKEPDQGCFVGRTA